MRPLRLIMSAFGPFAGEQTIDFGELGDHSFFLIHGPTGAGKSSILDAVCFALYGETSGEERAAAQMRSDHAALDTETFVVLDFGVRGQTYRVRRSPTQQRPKKRGEGTTTQQTTATLWKLEGDVWTTVVSSSSAVTAEAKKLLGFEAQQFRQVVVLPQGQFRKLLSADSNERQAILRTLFATDRYGAIEEALKKRSSDLAEGLKQNRDRRTELLGRLGVEQSAEVPGLIEAGKRRLAEMQEERKALDAQRKVAQEKLDAGRVVQGKLDERKDAESKLATALEEDGKLEDRRKQLERARKAETLRADLAQCKARRNEAAWAAKEADQAAERLAAAKQSLGDAEQARAAAEARKPEAEEAANEVRRLGDLAEVVGALDQAGARVREAEEAHAEAKRNEQRAARQVKDTEAEVIKAEQLCRQSVEAHDRLEGLQAQHDQAERTRKLRGKLADLVKAHAEQTEAAKKREEEHARAQEREKTTHAALDELEARWRRGQASRLAADLKPYMPCPVCGSAEHPQPASSDEAVPTDAALDEMRESSRKASRARERTARILDDARRDVAGTAEGIDSARRELGEAADEAERVHTERVAELAEKLAAAKREDASGPERQGALDRARAKTKEAVETYEASRRRTIEAIELLTTARAVQAEQAKRVPESLRAQGALKDALEVARARVDTLAAALREAQAGWQRAQNLHTEAVTLHAQKVEGTERARSLADQAVAALLEALQRHGFRHEADLASALLSDQERKRLADVVRTHDEALAAARERLVRAQAAAEGLEAPDLEGLVQATQQAHEALSRHDGAVGALQNQMKAQLELAAELDALAGRMAERERQFGIVGRLAAVAGGGGSVDLRITFERYVLAALLDEVLMAASRRLHLMSRGRYELQRVGTQQDRRRAGGLDLEVMDAYTGVARRVGTLSGGEGFLASLALALGLADVVQAQSGGIRLDAIFVDEGFGSLDPEVLELAIRTLQDLQEHGRLVGIISHVPELAECIDVRLQVKASRQGSSARFVLP